MPFFSLFVTFILLLVPVCPIFRLSLQNGNAVRRLRQAKFQGRQRRNLFLQCIDLPSMVLKLGLRGILLRLQLRA